MLMNRNYDRLKREAVRYLGYGRNAVDDQTSALIDKAFDELRSAANRKSVYRFFDLKCTEDGSLSFGGMEISSKSLGRNLSGCGQVVLFGATLGIGVDRLIARKSIANIAEAVALQACAAALLEEYCDICQSEIAEQLRGENCFLRPRFSPGYGDFPIEYQREIMRLLDCAKQIGLTVTESCMMTPMKSVTAVIGISGSDAGCGVKPCEECGKKDCAYRRDIV